MSGVLVAVPKHDRLGEGFSKRERIEASFHPGRRTDGTQSAAHWVSFLSDLKKIILLCSFCRGKFNPRRHGYRRWHVSDLTGKTDGHTANGMCDACKQQTVNAGGGTAFIAEETYNLVNVDPADARRQARLRARAAWAGQHLTRRATRWAHEAAGRG